MHHAFSCLPQPQLEDVWEQTDDKSQWTIKEIEKLESGWLYLLVSDHNVVLRKWLRVDDIRKNYSKWIDPYLAQKKYAAESGFVWRDA